MSDPSWNLMIHRSAERELANVTGDAGDELTNRLKQLRYYKQPTSAAYVEALEDQADLFRVRVDGYRAICRLDPPRLEVVAVGTRSRIYDRLEVAKERAGLSD